MVWQKMPLPVAWYLLISRSLKRIHNIALGLIVRCLLLIQKTETMKKNVTWILAVVLAAGMGLTACKKYDEGPGLSLKSKTKRLTGVWKAEKVIDGTSKNDIVQPYTDIDQTWDIKDDGTLISSNTIGSVNGTWEFIDKKEKIVLNYSATNIDTMIILKLKTDDLWLLVTGPEGDEFHFIPK